MPAAVWKSVSDGDVEAGPGLAAVGGELFCNRLLTASASLFANSSNKTAEDKRMNRI